ncbi:MAG: phosphotransferase [Paracoccus hibiscisoli]|uniref:phosphotransferase n=1 Tax=Paracoccus hibiscisoli TaxID=2023261 RepID=UPI00391B8B7D
MLQPADRAIVARDPALPGLALLLDPQAVAALLGAPVNPVHLRYKPGTSCMATFRMGAGFVTLRALTRTRFDDDRPSPRRAALQRRLPDHAVIIQPPQADRRITALRKGAVPDDAVALRFKPERRLVLRRGDTMIKAMSPATWDRALRGAQFGAGHGGPQVMALDAKHHLITTAWLPGHSAEAAPASVHARIGAALAALHRGTADLPPRAPFAPPAALDDLAVLAPDLSAPIDRLRHALMLLHPQGPLVPSHGDFSADQVMIAPDGTLSIVDWDEAGLAPAAHDLGTYLARLDHDALTGTPTDDRAQALLQGYGPPPPDLAAHHAAALAALATEGFRTRRPDWPDLARRLLDRALQIVPQTDLVTAAADPALMTRLSGQPIARAALIRHKPGRRALFRYDDRLIGKMRVKGPDRRTPALHDRLRAAGLDGTGDTGVPAQRGRVDALNLWLQDIAPGQLLTAMIAPDGPTAPLAATGRALARLHAAGVPADRDWSMADEVAVMDRALDTPDTQALAHHLGRAALALPPGPVCGIHRDFYPDQVLIDDARVWLLDLDLYADGDPAIDLGNMLAHLDEYALRRGWDCAALAPQAEAFLAGYATLRPLPPHVPLMRAVSLARHVAIARRFDDRRHVPPLILHQLARMGMAPA